jgi:hypothetical protein
VGGFSLSSTQLFHYVAPALPAVAILLGVYLAERTRGEDMDRLFVVGLWVATGVVGFFGFTMLAGMVYFSWLFYNNYHGFLSWSNIILPLVFLLGAALIMALTIRGKQRLFPVAVLAGVTALVLVDGFRSDAFHIYGTRSSYGECMQINRLIKSGDQVLAYPYTPYSTAWYLWPRHVMHPTADGAEDGQPTVEGLYAQIEKWPGKTYCMIQKHAVVKEMGEHFGGNEAGWRAEIIPAKEDGRKSPDHTVVVVEPAKQ